MDAAADFVHTASLLIHIKSKMMLPSEPPANLEDAIEDPPSELVERLREHEQFRAAGESLSERQQTEETSWSRASKDNQQSSRDSEREETADRVNLVDVFANVLKRLRTRTALSFEAEAITVARMIEQVRSWPLTDHEPLSLSEILQHSQTNDESVGLFLALLELIRQQVVLVHQPSPTGDVWVKRGPSFIRSA